MFNMNLSLGKFLQNARPQLSPVPCADYTLTWLIANLDESMRELTYVVDACDCSSAGGSLNTLASISYTDDGNSPATHPTLPTGITVEVVDPTETCGTPSVTLGEQHFENKCRTNVHVLILEWSGFEWYGVWYGMVC